MIETIARLIFDLIQPTVQLAVVSVAAVGLLAMGRRRWGLRMLALAVGLFLLYGNPWLAGGLLERLEQTWPVLMSERIEALMEEAGDEPVYVIVLGAGHVPDPRLKPTQMLTPNVTLRLVEGIRVHRQIPGSILVTSASARHGDYSQAEAVRDAAIALGVDPGSIHIQTDPENTCQEARAFVRDHGPGTRVVIATAATHMRRAMMIFEQQGAVPVAAPASFKEKKYPDRGFRPGDLLPSFEYVEELEKAIKEFVGFHWDRRNCR